MATDPNLGGVKRDDAKVDALQKKKFEAWSRLREARAEMQKFDTEMIKAGATPVELDHFCW